MTTILPTLYPGEDGPYYHALAFAQKAHGTQTRKYTGLPYWTHLVAVATIVSQRPGRTIEMIQAALLHDAFEDTDIERGELFFEFGETVGTYVTLLTDPDHSFGNRAKRHAHMVERLSHAPPEVKIIKLADVMDNTATIVEHDPHFAVTYLGEKVELMNALRHADHELWITVAEQLHEAQKQLSLRLALKS